MTDPLYTISPLDGRYASVTTPLREYASEAALMRARVQVEVEYLIALANLEAIPLTLNTDERKHYRSQYQNFTREDARLIKQLETEGYDEYSATNHDVKAIEYFLRLRSPDGLEHAYPWIHFGLTSEDVTNLSYRLLIRPMVEEILLEKLGSIHHELVTFARAYRDLPMLSHTHGQPATPTTFGKEMAVFADRLTQVRDRITCGIDGLGGKLAGASGTYAAHTVAFPSVDWRAFSKEFVEELGFSHLPLVTQVNPGDDVATVFDALRGTNQILVDLARDMWLYISKQYLVQQSVEGETGSSTMPHKINPIDFENAEGNLSKANADLTFLAHWITTSRLQRDLTDSTVKRNIGSAMAYCLLGYSKLHAGLEKVSPNETAMRESVDDTPVILSEAIQTILRREGDADAYELMRDATRGRTVTMTDLQNALADLDIDERVRTELEELTPGTYTGLAADLVNDLEEWE